MSESDQTKEKQQPITETVHTELSETFDGIWNSLNLKERTEGSFGRKTKVFKPRVSADDLRSSGVHGALVRFILNDADRTKLEVSFYRYDREDHTREVRMLNPFTGRNVNVHIGKSYGGVALPFIRLGGWVKVKGEDDNNLRPARELVYGFSEKEVSDGDRINALALLNTAKTLAQRDHQLATAV